jgi:hypothetical protein
LEFLKQSKANIDKGIRYTLSQPERLCVLPCHNPIAFSNYSYPIQSNEKPIEFELRLLEKLRFSSLNAVELYYNPSTDSDLFSYIPENERITCNYLLSLNEDSHTQINQEMFKLVKSLSQEHIFRVPIMVTVKDNASKIYDGNLEDVTFIHRKYEINRNPKKGLLTSLFNSLDDYLADKQSIPKDFVPNGPFSTYIVIGGKTVKID